MQYEYKLQTPTNALYDITRQLEEAIEKSGVKTDWPLCTVRIPPPPLRSMSIMTRRLPKTCSLPWITPSPIRQRFNMRKETARPI